MPVTYDKDGQIGSLYGPFDSFADAEAFIEGDSEAVQELEDEIMDRFCSDSLKWAIKEVREISTK